MSTAQVDPTKAPPAHIVFAQLRDVLADLYMDNGTAQLIVDDIGLTASTIAFTNQARTNWHRILAAAMRQDKVAELIARVSQDYPHHEALLTAAQAHRDLLARSQRQPTIPPEPLPALDNPPPRQKNNPWTGGSFYLLVFVVVIATLVIAANYVDWYVLPAILIAALLAVPLIGVFQALNDGTLSEKGFLQVVMESYRRLPLLRGNSR